MKTTEFKTSGMHCGSCSMLIEMSLAETEGVSAAKADFATGITHVEFDPAQVTVEDLVAVINGAGYDAEPVA
jgi:copper chaperone CopZ